MLFMYGTQFGYKDFLIPKSDNAHCFSRFFASYGKNNPFRIQHIFVHEPYRNSVSRMPWYSALPCNAVVKKLNRRRSSASSDESTEWTHRAAGTIETLISHQHTHSSRVELLYALTTSTLLGLRNLHEQGRAGFEFRPDVLRVTEAGVISLRERIERDIDSKFLKKHPDQAVRSILYCAPEVLRGADKSDIDLAQRSDIWSFGCLCLYILTANDPRLYRKTRNGDDILLNTEKNAFVAVTLLVGNGTSRPEYRTYCQGDDALEQFFELCFTYEPEKRPTAAMLMDCDFVRNKLSPRVSVEGDCLDEGETAIRVR